MSKKKCSYCDDTTYKSIVDAGWLGLDIAISKGKNRQRFCKRACPKHIERMVQEARTFMGEDGMGNKMLNMASGSDDKEH